MRLYGKNYRLVWEDHFDGDTLNPLWDVKHYYDIGHEERKAWRSPDNVSIENGNLVIRGRIEENGDYTSGMIKTDKSFCYKYGYAEIRAKLPTHGPGRWPGFWLCEPHFPGKGAGAEIDVLEMYGDDSYITCNIHSWWRDSFNPQGHHINYLGMEGYPGTKYVPDGSKYSDDYHTFGFEWTPEVIQFSLDGEPYCTVNINNPIYAFCHKPLFFIISMAYGLKHIGKPIDDGTPVEYFIDYIRLYQNEDGHLYRIDGNNEPPTEVSGMDELLKGNAI